MESDDCQVDLAVFDDFAKAVAADSTFRQRQVWRVLAEGFVVTVLAIAARADLLDSWPPPADALEVDLRRRARVLEPSLPR